MIRLVLAATLGATYGIYGPPFEQCVGTPVRQGSEEYLDSEKYQVRHWDLDAPGSLRDYIARINEIRRENPALHYNRNLRFFHVDNDADDLLRQDDARPVEHRSSSSSTSTRTTRSRAGSACRCTSWAWAPARARRTRSTT